ncbi:MAG: homocysteine S-methyltransferase family protein [Bacteroidetes bacterium]|nr:homocysteine S-methyltransferase family protein [Bacteroidota bacterium]
MTFEKIFRESKIILTEGAIVERLKAEFNIDVDSHINHAGMIYTNPEILEFLYRQYIDIAEKYNLPIMVMTPTRKVNFESLKKSKFKGRSIFKDSCVFLNNIRESYGDYSQRILLGGLMGCKGDAYSSKYSLEVKESYGFHKIQVNEFKKENIDFLFAGIMPEINEIIGMARAMAESEIPYIISFMIRKDGCLIDGTSISDAIRIIDNETEKQPFCYMTNCVHPANLKLALTHEKNINKPELNRFRGIQANASILSPEELNNCGILHQNDYKIMIDEMYQLHQHFGLKILGGCCGTNNQFINDLSSKIHNAYLGFNI